MCPVVYRDEGSGAHKPPAFMPLETFTRLLDQFGPIRQLHLQGLGEPLLHPRFFDMVRYAVDRGIEVSTNSNLTALSERRAQQCVLSGLRRLHVSLDAADPAAYEYIRIGSRMSWVLRNLSRLLEAKRRLKAAWPEIELVAVVMRRNLEQLPALIRLAHQYEVHAVSVQHLCHDFSEGSLPARYQPMRAFVDAESLAGEDPQRIERAFAAARAAAQELDVSLRLPRAEQTPRTPDKKPRCDWPWKGAYLSYSGQAMPCCMVATPDRINFGSMEKKGVAQVWNNESYRRFRSQLASDSPPEICRGCAVYNGTF
jgi:radical SAM protein with 4Fe4S-binding SPASM domain